MTYTGEYKGLKPYSEDSDGFNDAPTDTVKYEMMYDYTDEMQKEAERLVILDHSEEEKQIKEKKKRFKKFEKTNLFERDPNEPDKTENFFLGLFDFFDNVFRGFLGLEPSDKTERSRKKDTGVEQAV